MSELVGLDPARVDVREPFTSFGIVSKDALALSGDLEELLGVELSPTLLYEFSSIELLTAHLCGGAEALAAQPARPAAPDADGELVAIIGLGCRFPGADGPAAFWRLLCEGVDAVSKVPAERWSIQDFYDANPRAAGKMNTEWGGFLERADRFDARFFGISAHEAERMDPQHRMLLEVAWEALEDGGLAPQKLQGTQTGVFVGISTSDYSGLQMADPTLVDTYAGTGGARSMAANRLSYFFDFQGPSLAIDTACSSSLVAIHLACRSLNSGECTLALAGGVNFILAPEINVAFSKSQLLAPDGRCKSFDERADGYIRAEGAGVVVLKPLARALEDGDPVYAVIRGSAVNQDGRTNGITAPSPQSQEAVLREAQRRAGVTPGQVKYVEAHGSGTVLGDYIEAQALGSVLGDARPAEQPCAIGSVKSNIGHLEAAAGVAGVIKVALSLKHRQLPPSLHFETPNPHINFEEFRLRVQSELGPWPAGEAVAGVSSFGFGGTNAHLILSEVGPAEAADEPVRPQLLLLSAKTESALEAATANLAAHLKRNPGLRLSDVAYTLQVGRDAFGHRRAIVCESVEEALKSIEASDTGRVLTGTQRGEAPSVTFMFPGLGEQYPGMAADLYRTEPAFRRALDRCCDLLEPHLGLDLRARLFAETTHPSAGSASAGPDLRRMLRRSPAPAAAEAWPTSLSHPAIFAVEYALAEALMSWGVRPSAMIGYSLGEYVAACVSGVLSLEDALRVVALRARMIEALPGGAMLAVPLGEEQAKALIGGGLSVAAVNGPAQCVVSGPEAEVAALEQELSGRGVVSVRLAARHAFHSGMMAGAAEGLRELMRGAGLSAPRVPYVSNVTGRWVTGEEATDPDYWVRHLCGAVRFAEGAEELMGAGGLLLEVGPGQSLSSAVRMHPLCDGEQAKRVLSAMPGGFERLPETQHLLKTLGKLWAAGVEIDWAALHGGGARRRLSLPTYPFEGERHWFTSRAPAAAPKRLPAAPPSAPRAAFDDWFYAPVWNPSTAPVFDEASLAAGKTSWLVFADGDGLGDALVARLRRAGHAVTCVREGAAFAHLDASSFEINPSAREDYYSLVGDLGDLPRRVVHLWNVGEADSHERQLARSFYSLLFLAQALGDRAPGHDLHIAVLSDNAHGVTGEESLVPSKATLLGPCRVMPLEYANLSCRSIDIDAGGVEEKLVTQLLAELTTDSPDAVVAYRGGTRRVQAFERVSTAGHGLGIRLREEGVYLLTGGLGGLGLAIAERLATAARARLVLVGREGLPPREEWDSHLSGESGNARRIRKVKALEEAGAEVLVLRADVTDERQMREVLDRTLARFGRLNGVIHAAGLPGNGLIQLKTAAAAAKVLSPKVEGTLVLDAVCGGIELDFLALFSSITSIVGGGPGQVDYCAANSFLDAFARRREASGRRVVSINWAEWQWNAWEEGLAGFSPRVSAFLRENRQRYGIGFEEGAEAFLRVLSCGRAQVVVTPRDLGALIEESKAFRAANVLEGYGETAGRPSRRTASAPPAGDGGGLARRIAAVWQRFLPVGEVGLHDNFFDLGGNSLVGLQVVAELKKELGLDINAVTLYEAPTVSALAERFGPERGLEGGAPARAGVESGGRASRKGAGQSGGVAIIGMAGRFPGAGNVGQLWQNLLDGVESVSFFSDEELRAEGVDAATLGDPNYVRAGATVEGADLFDAGLFGYSPREAEAMDPQHRLFLECAWEALEDGGYDSQRYAGRVGVFGGSNISTYLLRLHADPELLRSLNPAQVALGNSSDSLTTRVSYKLNLRGPSVAVQTFCSTSAVATHLACRSLLDGECDMALAGGVRIAVPQKAGYFYEPGGINSPDGHCRAFDAKGEGAVLGNGVALVLLKRVEDALADGDHIYAVIKGSAVNNDGSLKVGYTAPSVTAQAQAVEAALADAGVRPEEVSYVEAHGTGTELGDPIELAALTKVYGAAAGAEKSCAIGSVKTNVGHLDRAAGVTSLIKAALSLKHRQLPPSLHFETPNPKIDFEKSPFYVNTALSEWKRGAAPLRAGVNALGVGGTNVHFVLEEPPAAAEPDGGSRPWRLLTLSARTENALESATANLIRRLKERPDTDLADAAYTLQVGRRVLPHRRTVVCRAAADAVEALERLDASRVHTSFFDARNASVTFMFPGLGEQYPGMAADLYRTEPAFRRALDRCCDLLEPHLGLDLRARLFAETTHPSAGSASAGPDLRRMLRRSPAPAAAEAWPTSLSHPAIFAVEYALAEALMSWGVRPSAMIGYSLGEYVAACVSGVLSLEDALRVVAERARLIEELPGGAMLAVPLPEEEARPLLTGGLSVAAVNGPSQCVVSGPVGEVEELERKLSGRGVVSVRLAARHAFHSGMMSDAAEGLRELMAGVELREPVVPYVSNVTGGWVTGEEATDPEYWVRHLCGAVRFGEGAQELMGAGGVLIEVGPGQTLVSTVKQLAGDAQSPVLIQLLPASYQKQSDSFTLTSALGKLWAAGVEIDWQSFYAEERRRRIPLPTYPFERQRYWIGDGNPAPAAPARRGEAGKRTEPADWFYQPVWKETALPSRAAEGDAAREDSCWLVFVDGSGVGDEVIERVGASGEKSRRVVRVEPGERFGRPGEHRYVIDPAQPDHYRRLVEGLVASGSVPTTVVHFWGVTPTGARSFDELQDLGFYSLVFLTRALGQSGVVSPLRVEVVSSEMQGVSGEEDFSPEKSTLLGACKVIPQEFPHITCRSIDIAPQASSGPRRRRLIEKLCAELASDARDTVVAYRGARRWTQAFEPVRLETPAPAPKRLRERGVYLITGGLGGVGLVLAETLARRVRARLVLTGRTGLPDRREWEARLAGHGVDDTTARRIRKVLELESYGAEVLVASADVADERQMRRVIDLTLERFGELNGVIHGAGIVSADSFAMIQGIERAECERHFDPKARGLYVLDKLLGERELDFYFLLSSLSSTLGGLGFAPYAAANIFMDSFAQRRNQAGSSPWISVNWDTWSVSEEAARELKERGLENSVAQFQMTPDEGADAFLRVLAQESAPHLVHSTGDLQARLDRWVNLTSLHEPEARARPAEPAAHRRRNLSNDYVAPETEAEKLFAEIWQQLLGLEQVGVHDNFFELGGDSILGIQVTARANKAGFRLTAKHVFENQTVSELAAAAESSRTPAEVPRAEPRPTRERAAFSLAKLDKRKLSNLSALIEKLEESEEEFSTSSR